MIARILDKYHKMPVTLKAMIWLTMCNILLKGIGLLSAPLFSRMLPSNEYGRLCIWLSYESILIIISTLHITYGAYQKGIFKYEDDIMDLTTSSLLLINLVTLITIFIALCAEEYICKYTGMTSSVIRLIGIFLFFQPAYTLWLVRKRTNYEYKAAVVATLSYSLLSVIVPIIAVVMIDETANIKYSSQLIIAIIFFIPFYIKDAHFIKLYNQKNKIIDYWKFLLKYQLPLVLHSLSCYVLTMADRIMIGIMVGETQAGYYSVAYSLATIITLFSEALRQVLTPWMYSKLKSKSYIEIKKYITYLILLMGVLTILFILITPEAMKILFSEEYYESVWCVAPITIGIYFTFLYNVFVNVQTYFEENKYIMYVSITCSVINIVLNYLLIDIFGYVVCGYTTLVCYILFAIGHFYFMRKTCQKHINNINVFNNVTILIISVTVLALSIMVTLLYDYIFIRYTIILLMVSIAILSRKKLLQIIRIIRNKA